MNTKTYNLVKYISTIGSVFLFTGPLLGFLQAWKNIFHHNQAALQGVSLTLTLLGAFLIGIYLLIRQNLKKKTPYVHTAKDLKLFYSSIGVYLGGTLFALITLIFTLTLTPAKTIMIVFAPFYLIEVLCLIAASMLESMSRVNEQIYLYQEENKRLEAIAKQDQSEQAAYSEQGIKRTNEGKSLLSEIEVTPVVSEDLKAEIQNALSEQSLEENEK